MYIPLTPTVITLMLALGLFFLARWRVSQPIRPENGPRMIPWTLVAVTAGAVALLMLMNLAVLAGLEPNRLR